jgi:hypothetical protein
VDVGAHSSHRNGPFCREIPGHLLASGPACHAEGRGFESLQPLSGNHCFAGVFRWQQSPCSSASCRTDSGLAVRRSSAASRKTLGLQADSRSSELKSFCRPAGSRVFRLLRRLAGCSRKRHVLARDACRALPATPILGGESSFSPDTVRSTFGPHSDPGEPWLPPPRTLRRRRPRHRRGARHGRLGPW